MSGGFEVDVDVLRAKAREHEAIARRWAALESERTAADLPHGALGKLPESGQIEAAFDARYTGLGEAIAALEEIYANVADGLTVTADGYVTSDEAVADLFRRLGSR